MNQTLKFDNDVDINGTALAGYFQSPFGFEETIARLVALSDQRNFENIDDKVWFEFKGLFNGVRFTIYDYKGDRQFHVGGPAGLGGAQKDRRLDVGAFVEALERELRVVAPESFRALDCDNQPVEFEVRP